MEVEIMHRFPIYGVLSSLRVVGVYPVQLTVRWLRNKLIVNKMILLSSNAVHLCQGSIYRVGGNGFFFLLCQSFVRLAR